MTPLRWGLLGTARINRLLIPAIRSSSRSIVAAVGSRVGDRAAAYARAWEIPRACAPYDALLAADVDVIYNALPNSLHVEWTLRALAAGKHVLCEKPLALAAADVDRIAAAAAAARRVAAEAFMYRHHAQTEAVLDVIRRGTIGPVRAIAGGFSYVQNRAGDVRLEPHLGGGALWDVGCYPVSFAQLIAGAAQRVSGHQQVGRTGVDEHFTGTLFYAGGVTAQVFASFRAAYSTFMRVTGTTGILEVDRPFRPEPIEHLRLRRDNTVEMIPVQGHAVFVDEVRDLEDAALGLRPPRLTLDESRAHAASLAALYESARTQRHVDVG